MHADKQPERAIDWESYAAGYQNAVEDLTAPRHSSPSPVFFILAILLYVLAVKFFFGERQ